MFGDRTHEIPGFLNPKKPENWNKRRFAEPSGKIEFKLWERPQNLTFPNIKVILSQEYDYLKDTLLNDTNGTLIFRREEPNAKESFWIRVNPEQILVTRGSYKIRVYVENQQVNEFDLIVKNNPLRIDSQSYVWSLG